MQPVIPSSPDPLAPLKCVEGTQSRSVDVARRHLSRAYRPHRLDPGPDHARFLFRHRALRFDGASLNSLEYGAEVAIDPGDFDSFYMVEFPLSGGVRGQFGPDAFSSSAQHCGQILSPGRPIAAVWGAGTRQLMLRVDREAMRRRLADLTGLPVRRAPIFRPTFQLDTALGRRIATLMQLMATEGVSEGGESQEAVTVAPLLDALLASLLLHQPHDHSALLTADRQGALPAHVARAAAFIEAHASQPLTISSVAREVGISERALQEGFRRFKGVSPHAFLQACRLDRARRLLSDTNEAAQVAAIARACGMPHASRFAQAYKARFGESPLMTRRRLSGSRIF